MSDQTKHLSNYRSAQQRVNAAAAFKVPGSNQKLDARLATEQMAALRDNLRIIEMRLAKAIKASNQATILVERSVLKLRAQTLMNLRDRQQGHIQRVADAINEQWARDDKWLASNEDKGTLLAQPYYRDGKERSAALALKAKALIAVTV